MSLMKTMSIATLLFGLAILACGQNRTEEELLKLAQEYEAQENFNEAVKTYEEQLDDYPKASMLMKQLNEQHSFIITIFMISKKQSSIMSV